jgi:signal transduction histidine kinase/ligand-binding sensor domain-containing protein
MKQTITLHWRLTLPLLLGLLGSSILQERVLAKTFSELEGGYIADHWNVDDGIPGTQILSIAQSTDGYIWLGTFYGLARFDGQQFTVFDANTPGFPTGRVNKILPGPKGSLWISVQGNLIQYKEGVFSPSEIVTAKPEVSFSLLSIKPDGTLVYSELNRQKRQRRLMSIRDRHKTEHAVRVDRPSTSNFSAATDQNGKTWWAHKNKLGILTEDGVSIQQVLGDDEKITVGPTPAKSGGIWLAVAGKIMRYDGGHLILDELPQTEHSQNRITKIIEAMDGSLWVGVTGGHYEQYVRGEKSNYVLQNNFTTKGGESLVDAEGTFWIASGTSGQGLIRIRRREFNQLSLRGPISKNVHAIIQRGTGDLLLGTQKGLYRIALEQIHDSASIQPIKLGQGRIWTLTTNRAGKVFGGRWTSAPQRKYTGTPLRLLRPHRDPPMFSIEGESFRPIDAFGPGIGSKILALCHDLENRLWIGSRHSGLARQDGDHFKIFSGVENFQDTSILSLSCDKEGAVWIGTGNDGIYRHRNDRFEHISKEAGIHALRVRAIAVGQSGDIWFGTGGNGIYRFRNNTFQQFSDEHGLPTNEISTLIDDHLGSLWFGSYNGVHRVSFDNFDRVVSGESKHLFANSYSVEDGLPSLQCNSGHPSSFRTDDGKLWFGTMEGVTYVDPKSLPLNKTPPTILLHTLYLDGTPNTIPQRTENPPFKVPSRTERIEIQFTGINFSAPKELRFRYRMTGIASDWTETGTQRSVVFQDLASGTYQFQITAANNSGVWNEEGASIDLIIEGPVWMEAWFQAVVGVGLIGLISLGFLIRIARDKRRKGEQDRFTRDMLLQQEADRKRIARELHDSLEQNLLVIKNRAALTLSSPANQNSIGTALQEISNISLDSIQEVRSIANNLRPYQIDRLGLDKAIQSMLNQIADASEISIDHEIEPIPKDLTSELQINLYRIIQEAMNNSLKHAQATQVIVTLLVSDHAITLRVKDNGRGFNPESEKAKEEHGFGLNGIRERSSMFNGTCELITAPGNGTEWIFRFPIGLRTGS